MRTAVVGDPDSCRLLLQQPILLFPSCFLCVMLRSMPAEPATQLDFQLKPISRPQRNDTVFLLDLPEAINMELIPVQCF